MKRFALLAALTALSACAAQTAPGDLVQSGIAENETALRGHWVLTVINDEAAPAAEEAHLDLGRLPQVSGSMGCNILTFQAEPLSGSLKIGSIAATRMMCEPEVMRRESHFVQAVSGQTVKYRIENGKMVWQTDNGSRFEFRRR